MKRLRIYADSAIARRRSATQRFPGNPPCANCKASRRHCEGTTAGCDKGTILGSSPRDPESSQASAPEDVLAPHHAKQPSAEDLLGSYC